MLHVAGLTFDAVSPIAEVAWIAVSVTGPVALGVSFWFMSRGSWWAVALPVPYFVIGVALGAGADSAANGGDADPQGLFFGGVATLSIPWALVISLLVAIARRDLRRHGERPRRAISRRSRVVRRLP